ncbi:MAG: hypothetical protein PHW69_03700 [Elusimicrobiaceae bacterium]|nr:hypothetical protein [Elusimicrobiaceae bacterium]
MNMPAGLKTTLTAAAYALFCGTASAWRLIPGMAEQPPAENFFPIGIYGVLSPDSVPLLKEAGFNTIQTYTQAPDKIAALATACRKNGMKLVSSPYRVMGSPYAKEARKTWPILAWYLYDEPEVHSLTPPELFLKYMEVKNWSQNQRTVFVTGEGKCAVAYGKSADALMVDWYPVPHLPLESAGRQIDTALKGLGIINQPLKPVWAVLQAFNWLYYPQHSRNRIGRYPTAAELRFMTYHSVLSGAKGVFYFTFTNSSTGLPLTEYPELWHNLSKTVKEIAGLRKVLESGTETECPAACAGPLACRAWKYDGKTYLVAANTANTHTVMPKALRDDRKWTVLFERSAKIEDLTEERRHPRFSPYRVFVLRSR